MEPPTIPRTDFKQTKPPQQTAFPSPPIIPQSGNNILGMTVQAPPPSIPTCEAAMGMTNFQAPKDKKEFKERNGEIMCIDGCSFYQRLSFHGYDKSTGLIIHTGVWLSEKF